MNRTFPLFKPVAALVCSLVVGSILLTSCKKKTWLSEEIHGKVVDKAFGNPIPFATVKFEENVISDEGEYFITRDEILTDQYGEFSFLRNSGHEFVSAEVDNYLSGPRYRKSIGPESEITIELRGVSWLKIKITNIAETDASDNIKIWPKFIDQSPLPFIFEGADVNEELLGMIRSNEMWTIRWLETHQGINNWHTLDTAGQVGDTLTISIAY